MGIERANEREAKVTIYKGPKQHDGRTIHSETGKLQNRTFHSDPAYLFSFSQTARQGHEMEVLLRPVVSYEWNTRLSKHPKEIMQIFNSDKNPLEQLMCHWKYRQCIDDWPFTKIAVPSATFDQIKFLVRTHKDEYNADEYERIQEARIDVYSQLLVLLKKERHRLRRLHVENPEAVREIVALLDEGTPAS